MTTLAMGAGMMPIALALGSADMSFRSPMAVAVIGGLITSTILSLLVVPAVFTYVDDFAQWFQRVVMRRKAREPRETSGPHEPREPREPRREEAQSQGDESVDTASIPEKFLYVRPGVTFVPTPRNWGGAPRERSNRPAGEGAPQRGESPSRSYESNTSSAAPAKSGGFFGWLKSLFGGSSAAEPVSAGASSSQRREGGDRHRGGRNRGGRGGEGGGSGGGGGQRRSRGGRGRGRSGGGYPPAEGSSQGGI
jgi:uncharacterized membrane protein YgcG